MLRLTPRQVSGSDCDHGVMQSERGIRQRDQFPLERISIAVVRIGQETTAERDEVMNIRKSEALNSSHLDPEALLGGFAQMPRSGSIGDELQLMILITPGADTSNSLASLTDRFNLIAFHFASPACQTTFSRLLVFLILTSMSMDSLPPLGTRTGLGMGSASLDSRSWGHGGLLRTEDLVVHRGRLEVPSYYVRRYGHCGV